jgi:hypothetical protein
MDKLSLLEEIIFENYLHINIGEYLSIIDNIKLITLSKQVLNNKINRDYFNIIIKKVSKKVILSFITKIYHFKKIINEHDFNIYFESNKLTKRYLALYYFKYYGTEYVDSWYNFIPGWKRDIIEKYKTKITDKPNSFDLFNLIKKIPVNDTLAIGW